MSPGEESRAWPSSVGRASEGDPLEALAVVAAGEPADMPVPDDAGLDQPCRTGRHARRGPAGAIRTGGIQRVAKLAGDSAWREHGVEHQRTTIQRLLRRPRPVAR